MVYPGDNRNTAADSGSTGRGRVSALRVMYTNIDGILSSVLEVRDYLKESKPDVLCLTETKLKEKIHLSFKEEGYNNWRRDRKGKGGGGIMIMVREDIYVEEVQYGDGMAEIISIIIRNWGKRRRIILTYIPPKTNTWKLEEHKEMQKEVLECLDNTIRKDNKILLMGDFNCKNVRWEEMEIDGNTEPWSEEMLQLALVNTLEEWVEEPTRYQGQEVPSLLDLVFSKSQSPD